MTSATASSESRNTFELAALRLLLCAQAAGAHHQTPMTRAQAASTRGRRSTRIREPHCFYQMYCKRECNTQKHGEPDKEQSYVIDRYQVLA